MASNKDLLTSINSKLDELKDKIHKIEITQTTISADLHYHIRRTDILEKNTQSMSEELETLEKNLKAQVQPFESLRFTWMNLTKILAFLATVGVLVTSIINYSRSKLQ